MKEELIEMARIRAIQEAICVAKEDPTTGKLINITWSRYLRKHIGLKGEIEPLRWLTEFPV